MEKTKVDELKEMKKKLIESVAQYNQLNPNNKVVLQDENMDVRNVFVCTFATRKGGPERVGLFRQKPYYLHDPHLTRYKAGHIYQGIGSANTAIRQLHDEHKFLDKYVPGYVVEADKDYVSNCIIKKSMSYDDVRLMMLQDNKIDPYEIGKASSSEEMLKVLEYASSYYKSNQEVPLQKSIKSFLAKFK